MQLFLIPASKENFDATVMRDVDMDMARQHLSPTQVERLEGDLGSRRSFNCWAMTENKAGVFQRMNPGDMVLFTLKETARFDYKASVMTTLESQRFGEALWTNVPGKPWTLIYLIEGMERVDLPKSRVVSALGYSPEYVVQGASRVKPEHLRTVIRKYGSFDCFIHAMKAKHTSREEEDQ